MNRSKNQGEKARRGNAGQVAKHIKWRTSSIEDESLVTAPKLYSEKDLILPRRYHERTNRYHCISRDICGLKGNVLKKQENILASFRSIRRWKSILRYESNVVSEDSGVFDTVKVLTTFFAMILLLLFDVEETCHLHIKRRIQNLYFFTLQLLIKIKISGKGSKMHSS